MERMQRYMSSLVTYSTVYMWPRNQMYIVVSGPTVTGLVFIREFRFLLGQYVLINTELQKSLRKKCLTIFYLKWMTI